MTESNRQNGIVDLTGKYKVQANGTILLSPFITHNLLGWVPGMEPDVKVDTVTGSITIKPQG